MKRFLFTLVILLVAAGFAAGQKIGYINTETILNKIPSYKTAQGQLERLRQDYQKEVEAGYQKVEDLYKTYQTDKVLLTEDMKKRREDEIINKEQAVKDLQRKYFGQDGSLAKKTEELLKPLQDKVANAVKETANEDGYGLVIDTANNPSIVFTNPRYDISDKVIKKLGFN
ncbi:MAG: OmpH family outer membrane protein [Prevotellaceae bacterium]|jgi:outer membrane protein|nr:OmpH family outer membrane protein [Prevotellaceae bacterium]